MDAATLTTQMKTLKLKARQARTKGEKITAETFAAGARRLWRKVRRLTPKVAAKKED